MQKLSIKQQKNGRNKGREDNRIKITNTENI